MPNPGMGVPRRGSTPTRVWDTTRMPATEQFSFWRDVVWEAFVPVSLTRRADGAFASSVSARTVGALGVSRIASQAQSVARTSTQIDRRAGDVFFLNMPLSEGSFASQCGRTARLGRGDFVLVDSTRPFELGFDREFKQISITLPHETLAPLLADPSSATGIGVPGGRGIGAVVSAAIRALARDTTPIDRAAARGLSDQIAGLVTLAVGAVKAPPASVNRALLLQSALDEVERSLGDPDLSPARVAERIGVSTRYLHQLFANRGPSFGRWLLARRLERCQRDLGDPTRSHWTVAAIAAHHGFHDPSYFARAFKARYGVSPREFRRPMAIARAERGQPERSPA